MGRNFVTGSGPDQGWLMPADPRQWLPGRHLAWSVLEQVGQMDLSAFENRYRADGQGGKAYDPVMMTGLLLYCYCKGLRSSREIEMATFDDVGARVICGNLHPDHATVAHFVRRHEQAVRGLLPESVKACAREGLVSLEVVAGDGTKLKASASMAANVTGEQLEAQIAELEELIASGVAAWVAEHLALDDADATAAAPRRPPGGDGPAPGAGRGGKKPPKRAAQMLGRRKAARGQLAARQAGKEQPKLEARAAECAGRAQRKQEAAERAWQAAAGKLEAWEHKAAAGRAPGGRKPWGPDADRDVIRTRTQADKARAAAAAAAAAAACPAAVPGAGAKVNTTDWTSRVMPLKKGGFDQLFNAQALATAGRQVILAVMRHDSPDDTMALHPLLAQARAVLDAAGISGPVGKAVFDAGYASDANFTAAAEAELYVALARESVQAGRSDGRQPQSKLPSWQDMAARLGTPEGKAVYKKRAATIEPVFAQLVNRLGRALNYRGDLADAELHLWAASHNLLKAITARTARTARDSRATRAAAVPATA
ncbi:MAG TPA: transposase [Trebonia sp.]|nr:transposase [Trebonia sp.]